MTHDRQKKTFVHPWVAGIVGALLITAIASTYTLYIAISTYTGVIEEHPYEKGLDFDQVVAQLELGKRLNAVEELQVDLSSGNTALLLRDGVENEAGITSVLIKAIRPNDADLDHVIELQPAPDSRFVGTSEKLAPGLWLLEILVDTEHGRARYRAREVLRQ